MSPLLIIALGILALLLLITWLRLNPFIAFVIVALLIGLSLGLSLDAAITSIKNGIGAILGSLVLILGFGAMLGKLIASSGAAQQITDTLIALFGLRNIHWALMVTGFVIGLPLFYTVGFVMMIPIIYALAARTKLPLLFVALPMLASLSVTHGYLPPHPAPTALAENFGADMGKTLLYGLIVAIPAIVIAGPILAGTVKRIQARPLQDFVPPELDPATFPSKGTSIVTALLPILFMLAGNLAGVFPEGPFRQFVAGIGNPVMAMLLSLLIAIGTLGLRRGNRMKDIMAELAESVKGVTLVLLVIAGSGALKQVLIDSGASDYIGAMAADLSVSPLLLGWLVATLLRVSMGSATVAGLTAAGIVFPVIGPSGVSPELMVLAIGSGSLMLSHVNDSGFWLFKEYFNLSVKDTLRSWTVMETAIGLAGLAGVLILNQILSI